MWLTYHICYNWNIFETFPNEIIASDIAGLETSYSSVRLQIRSWLLRLIWRTTWRMVCMWRFAAYFISPASRVCGDICTMEPSVLSAGILAFVEGRTGRDAGDETTTVTAAASDTAKETASGWANKDKVAALEAGSNENDLGSFIRGDRVHAILMQQCNPASHRRTIEGLPSHPPLLYSDMARWSLDVGDIFRAWCFLDGWNGQRTISEIN